MDFGGHIMELVLMKRRGKRFWQIFGGIMAVLSLSISSFAVCGCAHHGPPQKEETKSCHQAPAEAEDHSPEKDSATSPTVSETCICIQPPTSDLVKAESFKLKKQPALFGMSPELISVRVYSNVIGQKFHLSSLLYHPIPIGAIFARGPPAV
jgi:hypothetical protein